MFLLRVHKYLIGPMYNPQHDDARDINNSGVHMNALQISESGQYRPYLGHTRPAVSELRKYEKSNTTVTLYSAINPEQLFGIQKNNWQCCPEYLFAQLKVRPLSNQRTAEDIAQQWHVQKSGAGFVISFRVDAAFLRTLPSSELMGEQDYEFHVSTSAIKALNRNSLGSISTIKAFYSRFDKLND